MNSTAMKLFAFVMLLLLPASASAFEVRQGDLYLMRGAHTVEEQRELGFRPRRDVEAWPLVLPLDWEDDSFGDRNWRFHLHAWRMVDPLIFAYFQSDEDALLHEALDYVLDWHRQYLADGQESRPWWKVAQAWISRKILRRRPPVSFAWYDMAAGIRALRISFFIDKVRRGELAIDEDQMAALLELADAHARRLQNESYISLGNHGIFQTAGLNLLCMVVPERESCTEGRSFANRMYGRIMNDQFTQDGIHTENSPDYHFFVRAVMRGLTAIEYLDDPVADRREGIDRWAPWLVFPDRQNARIGDSSGRGSPLKEDPDDPRCIDERCFAVADLSRSGYAIVRSLPSQEQLSMLFVTGMAHRHHGHKHADDLSFELFEHGRFIFVDSGKYGYNVDAMRDYVISAAAHNTISIEDQPIGPRDIELSGGLLQPINQIAGGFQIEGSAERPDHFRQHRRIVYDPGVSLVISDTLTSRAVRNYVSSLHLAPDLEPRRRERGFEIDVEGATIRIELKSEGCSLSVARGQEGPYLGWQSVGYLKMTPTSVLRAHCPGKERRIDWQIALQ